MTRIIKPVKKIEGIIRVPGDKSISHRAIMIGAIARGITRVKGLPASDDCVFTANAFKDMGIAIIDDGNVTSIEGKGLRGLTKPSKPIHAGNSGTTMRLLAGILSGQDFETTLTCDEGLSNRPMARIIEPLSMMGAKITGRDNEYPPLIIRPSAIRPISYKTPVPSAQIKSAILFAGLYSTGVTKVIEDVKSRDHTERMLKYFGARINISRTSVSIKGGILLRPRTIKVPGDISSASFFIAGATLLKGSKIKIKDVSINPTRSGILKVLSKMGAKIKIINKKRLFEPVADIIVESSNTRCIKISKDMIPSLIDELPIIFVVAALSKGRSVIEGARELRVKETDRIMSMERNLKKMGAGIRVDGDDIIIDGVKKLMPSRIESYGDHRTCMAMTIAALTADAESQVEGALSISKSFPDFFETLDRHSV